MGIDAGCLERLRTALAGRRTLPYCDAMTVACFDAGIFLAQAGMDMPEWLATAPPWARAAVSVGHSASKRALEADGLTFQRESARPLATPTPAVPPRVVRSLHLLQYRPRRRV
jgi:hypothetical protein